MSNIIIAFPKEAAAQSIKKILAQSGHPVLAVCQTGAQVLQHTGELDSGIIICGTRFVDMMYTELREYLPDTFQMLLITSPQGALERESQDMVSLSLPLKVHELMDTLEMMEYTIARRKKKQKQKPKVRSADEQKMINDAKALLMERNHLSEEEAHKYMQKRSMDNGTGLVETAQMILSLMGKG